MPRQCLGGNLRFRGVATVTDELGKTADAVAAHLRFGTVRVEHSHLVIGDISGRQNENDAIPADTEFTVTEKSGSGLKRVFRRWVRDKAIGNDEVVADALHLGKLQFHSLTIPNLGV